MNVNLFSEIFFLQKLTVESEWFEIWNVDNPNEFAFKNPDVVFSPFHFVALLLFYDEASSAMYVDKERKITRLMIVLFVSFPGNYGILLPARPPGRRLLGKFITFLATKQHNNHPFKRRE